MERRHREEARLLEDKRYVDMSADVSFHLDGLELTAIFLASRKGFISLSCFDMFSCAFQTLHFSLNLTKHRLYICMQF